MASSKRSAQEKRSLYSRLLPVNFFSSAPSSSSSSQQQQQQPQTQFQAHFDPSLSVVWLDFHASSKTASHTGNLHLWYSGFFGKGTLSRSEPTWHERTLASVQIQRARQQGRLGQEKLTPEEMTAFRRRERVQAKIERAKLAVKAGTMLKDGIVALGGSIEDAEGEAEPESQDQEGDEEAYRTFVPGLIHLRPAAKIPGQGKTRGEVLGTQASQASLEDILNADDDDEEDDIDIMELERMQLSLPETFFLAGMLGVLQVYDALNRPFSIASLYHTLLQTALPLDQRASVSPSDGAPSMPAQIQQERYLRPDNPFLLHYVAYHHFRSLGWVVKSGLKFCVDLLLYKRGPVFSHAEFAVLVVPVYEDPEDAKSAPFDPPLLNTSGDLDWIKFHTFNRVNSHVQKTLILAHVHIPALSKTPSLYLASPEEMVSRLKSGQLWSVREVVIRRWSPARMRP
ncbi:tRNA splicing endonuclease subunit sen2 [Tilletia horrida]|nr:tRNA splicing endonuclease subunit sen2 [Tilletia horrida]